MSDLLKSTRFEVCIEGTHGLVIPNEIAVQFVEAKQKRVKIHTYFKGNEITFHGALHHYIDNYLISFGKRYQKELGVDSSDFFELQLIEDQSKYVLKCQRSFKRY